VFKYPVAEIITKSEVSEKTWSLLKEAYETAEDAYLVIQIRGNKLVIQPLTEWLESSDRR